MARKRYSKRGSAPVSEVFTPAVIIERMAANGATFRFTDGKTLIVAGLGKLPPALFNLFMDYEQPALLTAAAREYVKCLTASAGSTATA